MHPASQRIRILSDATLSGLPRLDIKKLGRPWHKLPALMNEKFDVLDARLSIYFLKKLRVSISLKAIDFAIDQTIKNTQIFATSHGNVAFDIDRSLLLTVLHDYYGLSDGSDSANLKQPVTKSEERLKTRLGQELAELILCNVLWDDQLEIKPDYAAVISQWSWCVTFSLHGYETGSFRLLFDHLHVDKLLGVLRHIPDVGQAAPLSTAQVERLFYGLPLKLNARLASLNLTVAQLAGIQPGDVLMIALNDPLPVSIGKEQIFEAQIAEEGGKLFLSEFHEKNLEKHYDRFTTRA